MVIKGFIPFSLTVERNYAHTLFRWHPCSPPVAGQLSISSCCSARYRQSAKTGRNETFDVADRASGRSKLCCSLYSEDLTRSPAKGVLSNLRCQNWVRERMSTKNNNC